MIVANAPRLLFAEEYTGEDGRRRLIVNVSPVVPDDDPILAPVRNVLAAHEYKVVETLDVEDDAWWFGRYASTLSVL